MLLERYFGIIQSSLSWGKNFDTCVKAVAKSNRYTSELLADLLYIQWGSLGPLRINGKLMGETNILLCLACDEVILLVTVYDYSW